MRWAEQNQQARKGNLNPRTLKPEGCGTPPYFCAWRLDSTRPEGDYAPPAPKKSEPAKNGPALSKPESMGHPGNRIECATRPERGPACGVPRKGFRTPAPGRQPHNAV